MLLPQPACITMWSVITAGNFSFAVTPVTSIRHNITNIVLLCFMIIVLFKSTVLLSYAKIAI